MHKIIVPKPTQKHIIRDYTKQGISMARLSVKYDYSLHAVRMVLIDNNIPRRVGSQGSFKVTTKDVEVMVRMYNRGICMRIIAEHLGLSYGTVNRYLNSRVKIRSRGGYHRNAK